MDKFEYSKHPFLKELGIEPENFGAYYNGKWQGDGEVLKSINPVTEEVISTTKSASVADYENALKGMCEARAQWASVQSFYYLDDDASQRRYCSTNRRSI